MKTLIIMALLATFAFAGVNEFGVQVGYWNPTGDAGDAYDGNFYFGGQFLSHMEIIAIEASIGYTPLKLDGAAEDALKAAGGEFSGHIIPLTCGVRSYTNALYAAAGLEIDMKKAEWEYAANPTDNTDNNGNELGGYIGAGIVTPLGTTGDIDISIRLHLAEFETDQMWIGICGGLNF
ncbi:MAG: hypothetical protein KAR40_15105 [Candidatus Sabulitectum sp.]|nr:hypothetical protein [Candidatus Sabulitectum sp.]